MDIKILGTGCPKCKTLEKLTREAVSDLGIEANITKEEDIIKIMGFGVLHTPGLVINNKVVMSGRLPSLSEIKNSITENN
ncbi:MAG: thioredoxin family protein [Bacteroidales bacterium]|jgi:small redox-active disulfide protein 2|nr:TM0996/MTH895 family glutaredoxin-like protein [Bacteroidota bacterium]MCF8349233.1 thioredoxin family protein [Bacteroidales bacterium]